MRIGVVTPWDTRDAGSWSGVVKPMVAALREVGEVVEFVTKDVPDSVVDRALARLLDGRFGRRYLVGHALATSWKRGRALRRRLQAEPVDVIVGIAASQDIAFLGTDTPIVQVSDTTFKAIKDFYPLFTNLNPLSSLQAGIQAALSSRRTAHTLAASQWAKQALIRDDGLRPEDITVAPLGPAVEPTGPRPEPQDGPLRLLMVSSDWERKGGPDVIAVCEELRRRGFDFELTVVGNAPALPSWVNARGRVPREEMPSVYSAADVLLELATSNAAGVVLTDAAGFGLPVVAADTGGVSSIVVDGESGLLVRPGDVPAAASRVEELGDREVRRRMSQHAARRAAQLLNWRAWAVSASEALAGVAGVGPALDEPVVAFFSPAVPYPGIEHAGGQYLRRLHDALADTHRATWLVQDRPSVRHAFQQPGVVTSIKLLADQQTPSRNRRKAYLLADRIETLCKKADSQPVPLGPLLDLATRRDVRRVVRSADVLDFQWAAWTKLAPLAKWWNPRARVTFTFHDVMSQKCTREERKAPDRLRRMKWKVAGLLAKRWERRALRIADTVIVFSQKDRDLIDPHHRHDVVVIDPPLAAGAMPTHVPNPDNRVLLVGYMARQENVDAFLWFADDIWPRVRSAKPDAELHAVGGSMPSEIVRRLDGNRDGIVLRGFVEDLAAEYEKASVVAVPLRHGAGVKFKTIEALLAGVPVVTTPIGAEGIGDASAFEAMTDDAQEFADAVIAALSDPAAAQTRADSRQAEFWPRYSLDSFSERVRGIYRGRGAVASGAGHG